VAFNGRQRVDVYYDEITGRTLNARFGYCFTAPAGSDYPPILRPHEIAAGEPIRIGGAGGAIEALPFRQIHGSSETLGFRFGGIAYSPDVSSFPEESIAALQDLDVWIIDALRPAPHPSHLSVDRALDWIARLKPKRAVLTHMHVDLDYATLARDLPQGVEPAYDGMVLTTEA
jgi:phosphoribosyl 1,2-cyclic phosphate phosphodiesterase